MALVSTRLLDIFEPALYSRAELEFFRTHLGKTPRVAKFGGVPPGVNLVAVDEVLGTVADCQDLVEAHGEQAPWCGLPMLADSIVRYLNWMDKSMEVQALGGPRHPSMFAWDSAGAGHKFGVGSDSEIVRTEIQENGERRRFAVMFRRPSEHAELGATRAFIPSFARQDAGEEASLDLVYDEKVGTVTCPVSSCGWVTNFNTASASLRGMAVGRMRVHLRDARDEVTRHRAVWTHVFRAAESNTGVGRIVRSKTKRRLSKAQKTA